MLIAAIHWKRCIKTTMFGTEIMRVLLDNNATKHVDIAISSIDEKIEPVSSYPAARVIKTDEAKKPGQHWVGAYITESTTCFFDSYGFPPLEETYKKLLEISTSPIVYNKKCVQSLFTSSCGAFVACFVYCLSNGYSFDRFLNLFDSDLQANEKIIERFYRVLYRNDV